MVVVGVALRGRLAEQPLDRISLNWSTQFKEAQARGIHVVEARHLVDPIGDAIPGIDSSDWRLIDDETGRTQAEKRFAFGTAAELVVVFVHGYNTNPARALERSNRLYEVIAGNDSSLTVRAEFVSFLWRGDLGERYFSRAQRAASATAPALAHVISAVSQQARGARIVVVAHSLGSQVVLDALGRVCRGQAGLRIDGLVLIQAAVPAHLAYSWTREDSGYPIGKAPEFRKAKQFGPYAAVLRCARYVLYTVSAADLTLRLHFRAEEFMVSAVARPPSAMQQPYVLFHTRDGVALGTPFSMPKAGLLRERRTLKGAPAPGPQKPTVPTLPQLHEIEGTTTFVDGMIDHPFASDSTSPPVGGFLAAIGTRRYSSRQNPLGLAFGGTSRCGYVRPKRI